jgi:hypothetical protein
MVRTQSLDDYITARPASWERLITFRTLRNVNNPRSVHGIYPYRGKISAIDARQIISQLPKKGTLLDPFCGSGTIVYEARQHGINAIGVDNNPIAIAIAKGKLERNELVSLKSHLKELLLKARSLQSVPEMPRSPARRALVLQSYNAIKLSSTNRTVEYSKQTYPWMSRERACYEPAEAEKAEKKQIARADG